VRSWASAEEGSICPPGNWEQEPKFSRKPEGGSLILINWFDSCIDIYLPVRHWHCTRADFTILVSCCDELAVHSCGLFFLQNPVAKLASGLFHGWSLLRDSSMATNLQSFTDTRVSKLRPAGYNRPAKPFHPAREDILPILKK